MKAPRHTPGPWVVSGPDVHGVKVFGPLVPEDGERFTIAENMRRQDARLIAAAPELAEALEAALKEMRQYGPTTAGAAITLAEAALKKAGR
jgi:hypothetical protein